jgi:threonine/homoserine/homoserine lactone efflux protein
MTTVMHILAILALIYVAGVSLGVVIIFAVQIGLEHGRRQDYENKINKP